MPCKYGERSQNFRAGRIFDLDFIPLHGPTRRARRSIVGRIFSSLMERFSGGKPTLTKRRNSGDKKGEDRLTWKQFAPSLAANPTGARRFATKREGTEMQSENSGF